MLEDSVLEMDLEMDSDPVQVTVVGVGNAGGSAVEDMIDRGLENVAYVVVNTDRQALEGSRAGQKLSMEASRPEGIEAIREELTETLRSSDLVLVIAGMGGTTGTNAAPVVAEIARSLGILTIGLVTKPFDFEEPSRKELAEKGISDLLEHTDSTLVFTEESLRRMTGQAVTSQNAFALANEILSAAVRDLVNPILLPGVIQLDLADVSDMTKNGGTMEMAMAHASGEKKKEKVVQMVMESPAVKAAVAAARGLMITIACSADVGFEEVDFIIKAMSEYVGETTDVIWSLAFDEHMENEIRMTAFACGLANAI